MDIVAEQIAKLNLVGERHPFGIICSRVGYSPDRDKNGCPLNLDYKPNRQRKPLKMDRFILALDGVTYLDGEIVPSSPPERWIPGIKIIWNGFLHKHHWQEDDVLMDLKPDKIITLDTLLPLLEKYVENARERLHCLV